MASAMRTYRKPGFDVMKDFVHVGRIGISDLTVVTSPGSGITSMAELVARGRKEPGKLMFASGGIGSPAPIVQRVAGTLQAVLARAEFKAQLDALGGAVAWLGPKDYTEALRAEMAHTDKLMAAAKLAAQ